jgi:ERCC4-type nuclease
MNERGLRVVADVHERESRIPELLRTFGASVETRSLVAGDYLVGETVIVERKRVLDLHAAVIAGRLWRQLGALRAQGSRFPYLIVEGTDLDRGPLNPSAVRGICLTAIELGIALVRSDHQRDTASWLFRLAARERVSTRCDRPIHAQRPKRPAVHPGEAMLAAVPGISTASARALLKAFDSVAEIAAAGPAAWRRVPGIGPVRSRRLEHALSSPFDHRSNGQVLST